MNRARGALYFGGKYVRNLLHLSGDRAYERAPAPCACGEVFSLYPWQDLPRHRCVKRRPKRDTDGST